MIIFVWSKLTEMLIKLLYPYIALVFRSNNNKLQDLEIFFTVITTPVHLKILFIVITTNSTKQKK